MLKHMYKPHLVGLAELHTLSMLKSSCLHFILGDWSPLSFVFVWLCHHMLIVVSVCLCHNQVPHIIIKHLVKNGSFPDFSTAWVSLNWPRSWLSKWPTCWWIVLLLPLQFRIVRTSYTGFSSLAHSSAACSSSAWSSLACSSVALNWATIKCRFLGHDKNI